MNVSLFLMLEYNLSLKFLNFIIPICLKTTRYNKFYVFAYIVVILVKILLFSVYNVLGTVLMDMFFPAFNENVSILM